MFVPLMGFVLLMASSPNACFHQFLIAEKLAEQAIHVFTLLDTAQ